MKKSFKLALVVLYLCLITLFINTPLKAKIISTNNSEFININDTEKRALNNSTSYTLVKNDNPFYHHLKADNDEIFILLGGVLGSHSSEIGDIYDYYKSRDDNESALSYALFSPDYSSLNDEQFNKFFALPNTRTDITRKSWMKIMLWAYEARNEHPNDFDLFKPGVESREAWQGPYGPMPKKFSLGFRLSTPEVQPDNGTWSEFYHTALMYQEMMQQYKSNKNTILNIKYNAIDNDTGQISFEHDGFVPHESQYLGIEGKKIYDTYLEWDDNEDFDIIINGTKYDNNIHNSIPIKIEDDIIFKQINQDNKDIDVKIIDKQIYLKAASIKGAVMRLQGPYTYSMDLVHGSAQFGTLSSTLKLQLSKEITPNQDNVIQDNPPKDNIPHNPSLQDEPSKDKETHKVIINKTSPSNNQSIKKRLPHSGNNDLMISLSMVEIIALIGLFVYMRKKEFINNTNI
ncbi:MAG: hypothetical protein LBT75_05395 [Bacilli bacterium]|nr:hypothetical protein [Bacilli bacterium]